MQPDHSRVLRKEGKVFSPIYDPRSPVKSLSRSREYDNILPLFADLQKNSETFEL